jgi:hypothetical protein
MHHSIRNRPFHFRAMGCGIGHALNHIHIHFNGGGSGEHFNREHQSDPARFANEDSLNSFQRSGFDPHQISTFEKWVRFEGQETLHQATYGLNFIPGNFGRPASPAYKGMYARRRYNAQYSIQATLDEHVIGEKREHDFFLTVLPPADASILRKKYFESLSR